MSKLLHFKRRDKQVVRRTLYALGYEAQLFRDSREVNSPFFHYIVTRSGSADILAWGQVSSEEEAEEAAMECIMDLHGRAMAHAG